MHVMMRQIMALFDEYQSKENAKHTPAKLHAFADAARTRLRGPDGGYRRDHLSALAQRVEVADGEIRIMGSRSNLLRTLATAGGVQSAAGGVPPFVRSGGSGGIRTLEER